MTHTLMQPFLHELQQLTISESIPCVGGPSDLPTQPGLKVQGRAISLPVNNQDLEWLCQQGRRSPFGKGMNTLVDQDIRHSTEFEAEDIELLNPHWSSALEDLLDRVMTQMTINFAVEAQLFKLLV